MTMAVYYCEDCKISTASEPQTAPKCRTCNGVMYIGEIYETKEPIHHLIVCQDCKHEWWSIVREDQDSYEYQEVPDEEKCTRCGSLDYQITDYVQ